MMGTIKISILFGIVGITLTFAMKLDMDINIGKIYEAAEKELEAQLQLRSTNQYKWISHTWKNDGPSEMSKRNKIFHTMRDHLKNQFDLDDATARTFAKRALHEFRSSGSEAVTRTSVLCNDETAVICDSFSKFRSINGSCNNLEKPFLGALQSKFIREVEVKPYDALSIIISDPDIDGGNNGEAICEGHGYGPEECNVIECCKYYGVCQSQVGSGPCFKGNELPTGEDVCENRGLSKKECDQSGCCQWSYSPDLGRLACMSAIMDAPCVTGETTCEGHGYNRQQCNALGCCQWSYSPDLGRLGCMSAVGSRPCTYGSGPNYTGK